MDKISWSEMVKHKIGFVNRSSVALENLYPGEDISRNQFECPIYFDMSTTPVKDHSIQPSHIYFKIKTKLIHYLLISFKIFAFTQKVNNNNTKYSSESF